MQDNYFCCPVGNALGINMLTGEVNQKENICFKAWKETPECSGREVQRQISLFKGATDNGNIGNNGAIVTFTVT